MNNKHLFLVLLYLCTYKNIAQSINNVKFINHKTVFFNDANLRDSLKLYGLIRVYFTDSIKLAPKKTKIIILKTLCLNKKLILCNTKNRKTNNFYKKYLLKIDSIFMYGKYQFYKENDFIVNKKFDFSFSIIISSRCSKSPNFER